MKHSLASLLLFLALIAPAAAQRAEPAKKPYVVYAEFLQDTQVELSDASVWMMDKGDCFPIWQFKEHGTKVILQMAGTTNFAVDAERVKVLPDDDKEKARALVSYRKNLTQYLSSRPDAWKTDSVKKKDKEPRKDAPKFSTPQTEAPK